MLRIDETKIQKTNIMTHYYDEYLTGFALRKNHRSYTHYHPSEIGGCIRKSVAKMLGTPGNAYTHGRAQRTFANGHKTHDRLQADLGDMGILLGRWECENCGFVMGKQEMHGILKPSDCEECHAPRMTREVRDDSGNVMMARRPIFHYKELPVTHPTLNISGHCDGIVKIKDIKFVIDFKTISSSQFQVINEAGVPHDKYVGQINQYMFILGIPLGMIFYECSDNKKTAEFFCQQDMRILDDLFGRVVIAEEYRMRGELPPIDPQYVMNPENFECSGFPGYPPCDYLEKCFPKTYNSAKMKTKLASLSKIVK